MTVSLLVAAVNTAAQSPAVDDPIRVAPILGWLATFVVAAISAWIAMKGTRVHLVAHASFDSLQPNYRPPEKPRGMIAVTLTNRGRPVTPAGAVLYPRGSEEAPTYRGKVEFSSLKRLDSNSSVCYRYDPERVAADETEATLQVDLADGTQHRVKVRQLGPAVAECWRRARKNATPQP